MKMLRVHRKNFVPMLTTFSVAVLVFFVSVISLASETTDFEVGTQFGMSYFFRTDADDSTITYIRLPSTPSLDIASPTSLYATWFPSKNFAVGPEFSLGRVSIADGFGDSGITSFYLGGRAAYFRHGYDVSNPYVLGRVSTTLFSGDDIWGSDESETWISVGVGAGYQWRIGPALVLRAEGQYQRTFDDENINDFSFIIGLGTRFGNNEN